MNKELSDLVARVAVTMAEGATPTAVEILRALNEVAEEAERIGFTRGALATATDDLRYRRITEEVMGL
jgi:hypothetical protein